MPTLPHRPDALVKEEHLISRKVGTDILHLIIKLKLKKYIFLAIVAYFVLP